MKLLLDIQDNQAAAFFEMLKGYNYVKAQTLSEPDAKILAEIKHIKKALKDADKIKSGKLTGRPASELLNEL